MDIYWHCRLSQDRADKKTLTENKETAESMMHRMYNTMCRLMTASGLRTSVSVVINGVAECQEYVVRKDIISDNDAAGRRCAGIGQAVLLFEVRQFIRNEKSGHMSVPASLSWNCRLKAVFIS